MRNPRWEEYIMAEIELGEGAALPWTVSDNGYDYGIAMMRLEFTFELDDNTATDIGPWGPWGWTPEGCKV